MKTLSKKLIQNLFFVRRSQMKNILSGDSIKAMKSVLCREIVLLSYKHLKLQMRLRFVAWMETIRRSRLGPLMVIFR